MQREKRQRQVYQNQNPVPTLFSHRKQSFRAMKMKHMLILRNNCIKVNIIVNKTTTNLYINNQNNDYKTFSPILIYLEFDKYFLTLFRFNVQTKSFNQPNKWIKSNSFFKL